ncbi:complement C1q subcomponent subunit B-like [Acanthaster planci]|uniref:Complement C1q subcomponent subunit B-like n=1 Tax=Acanthaster planci TaxID=133434 RepID=A0A8B7ZZT7_ACAPL|nr:complement C1q subcomponent subunit B-like [Acanthaster planci]
MFRSERLPDRKRADRYHHSKMHLCFAITLSFVILLRNSITLRATVTGPAPADSDGLGSQVCPMCCQGIAGTPGIPGLPGNQGQYGPAGVKGNTGVKGQKGEIGPIGAVGSPGRKGDDGIGLPGKVGPRGPPGLVGTTGEAGVKGQKGDPGETPDNSARLVAFTVMRTSDSDTSTNAETRLPFEQTMTLLQGTDFDLATGTFTCTVPGTYVFTFSVCKYYRNSLYVHLRRNNDWVVSGRSTDSGSNEQVSGSAVLVLNRGDSVYLTMAGKVYGTSTYHYTSFSGFLLNAK